MELLTLGFLAPVLWFGSVCIIKSILGQRGIWDPPRARRAWGPSHLGKDLGILGAPEGRPAGLFTQ